MGQPAEKPVDLTRWCGFRYADGSITDIGHRESHNMCAARKAAKRIFTASAVDPRLDRGVPEPTDVVSAIPLGARLCQTRASWRNPPAIRSPRPPVATPTGPL
ncbi:hypothetical protein ACTI_15990 [Actinoplanes sp. OR16]|nr:hypothetical protein ACTI_15990 [Actinoplanes sp. OR16]